MNLTDIAKHLDACALNVNTTPSLRTDSPFDLAQAYEIQEISVQQREQRGEKRVGVKLGFTSQEKMKQMGVNHLIWGVITDAMQLNPGDKVALDRFNHPRIEPEIAFITKAVIDAPLSRDNALEKIAGICPAMEIIDSRYEQFKFTLEDVVADNTSSAAFVLGDSVAIDTDISNLSVTMYENDTMVQQGTTAALMGHPLNCLVQVSELLAEKGQSLPAGSIILAGAATAAHAMQPNCTYKTEIEGMPMVSVLSD